MFERRSLKWPITLGVVMIVLLVVLTVGWVLLAVFGGQWTWLSIGTTFLAFVLAGVIMYLVLTVKAINLSRRQSNFIDSVTHELKSPIASLKLYLQTLNRHHVEEEERESFYRYMLDDVERLDQLINHLLDAARLDKSPVVSEIEDVNLADLLRHCAETVCLRYQAPADVVQLDLAPCQVRARRGDLDVIFRNLLDNAVKYAGDEPHVSVELRPTEEGRAVVRIADNGRGIPLKLRRKIFGRFVRLGKELERDKPGTGLGLYIVRTMVVRLRGKIRISDPASGTGTVFEVQIPGALPMPAAEPAAQVLPLPEKAARIA